MAAYADAAETKVVYLRAMEAKARLSLIEIPPDDDGLAGARLAIDDNNTTGRFLNQQSRWRMYEFCQATIRRPQ